MRSAPFLAAIALFVPGLLAAKPGAPPPALIETGKASQCISERNLESIRVIAPKTLLFTMQGGRLYRSDLDSECAYDPDWDVVIHQSTQTGYCESETLTIQRRDPPGVFRGSCILGAFTPVKLAPARP